MAINEVPQSPLEKRYGFAEQSAWGTGVSQSGNYDELDCEHAEIRPDVKTIEQTVAHGTRTKRDGDIIYHKKRAMPTITLAMLAKQDELQHFLYAAMQSVSEGASTPYAKTFTLPTTQPNFASSAGYFNTIVERDPSSGAVSKGMIDCVSRNLTITLNDGEALKVSQEWIGRGYPAQTQQLTGTWTRNSADYWWANDIARFTVNFGGGAVSLHLISFELVIAHDIVPVGQASDGFGGAGSFKYPALVNRQLTWKVQVVKDSDFHTALTNWAGNTAVDIRLGWGNVTPGTTDGDLDFQIHGKIGDVEKNHDEIISGTLSGVCLESDDGNTEAIQVVMANAVDEEW
jgi:hypothetical protein